ncbi:hypothetical protein BCR44DRAFT_69194 [Catenaria anguillulae PL171]|uniref:Uncharacterized protein n=1 Tax=Catenaria anguillulae PL171 TaxID=765915 RepID=A0A1Y2H7X4_9FUNG|nr:hypothetical protein BCR44DRAFT_69194 [Catenaria anguillulae PL171]
MPSSASLHRPSLTSSNASVHKGGNAARSKSALAVNGPPDRATMRSLSRGDITKKEITKWDEFYNEYQAGMGDIDRVLKSLTSAKSFLGGHATSTHSLKRSSPSVSRPRTPSPGKPPSPPSRQPVSASSILRSSGGLAQRSPSPASGRRGTGTQRDLKPTATPSKQQAASLRASGSVNSIGLGVGNMAPSPSRSSLMHVGFQTPVRGSQVLLSSSQRDLIERLEAAAASQSIAQQNAVPTTPGSPQAAGVTAVSADDSIALSASLSTPATPSRSLYSNHVDVSVPAIAIEPPSRLQSVNLDDDNRTSPEKPILAPSQQSIAIINASRASVDNVADVVFNRSSANLGIGQLGAPGESHIGTTGVSAANLTPSQANMSALFSNPDLDAKPRRSTARLMSTTRLSSQSPSRQQRSGHAPAPTNTPPNERQGGKEDYAATTRAAAAEAAVVRLQARLTEKNTTISNLAFRVRQLERQVHWAQVQGQANAAAAGLDAAHRSRVRELESRLAKDAEVIRGLVKEIEACQGREREAKETIATLHQRIQRGTAAVSAPVAPTAEVVRVVEAVPVPVVVDPAFIRQVGMAVRSCQESGLQSRQYPQFASAISSAIEVVRAIESNPGDAMNTHSRLHHAVPNPSATITRLFNCITDLTGAIEQHFVKQVNEPVITPRVPKADASTQSYTPLVVHSETQSAPAPATWESSVQANDRAEAQITPHKDEAVGPDSAPIHVAVSVATETVQPAMVQHASAGTGTDAVKTDSAGVQTADDQRPIVIPNGTQTRDEFVKPTLNPAGVSANSSVDVLLAMFAKMNAQNAPINGSGSEVDQLLLRLLSLKGENERLRRRQSTHHAVRTTPAIPPQQQQAKDLDGTHSRELAELRHAIHRLEERLLSHSSSFTPSTPSTTSSSIPPPPPPPPVLFPAETKPAPKPSKSHKKGRDDDSSDASLSSSDASTPPRRSRHRHRSSHIPPPQNIDIQLGPSPQSPAMADPTPDPKLVSQLESVTQSNQALAQKIQALEHQLTEMQVTGVEALKADQLAFKYQPPNLDALRDAEHSKVIAEYQSQLAHLSATIQSLHDQLAHRDLEISHLRDQLDALQSLGPQWSADLDKLVESLSQAVAEQQRQSEAHLQAAQGMVHKAVAGEQQERANAQVLADAVRAHVARAADLVRELDDTHKQLSAAKDEVAQVKFELEREREIQAQVKQLEQECRTNLGSVQAKLIAYDAQWASVAHLAPAGIVEGQFAHVCQHLAMDLERQRDHSRAMQAELLGLRQAKDAAETSSKDQAAKVDRLAELVSRAERSREDAVKSLTKRVRVAEREAADAKTRLARVLKGVYLYVASSSAGDTASPSSTGIMQDHAGVTASAIPQQSAQVGSGDVEAVLATLAGGVFSGADNINDPRDSSMLDGLSELDSFGIELSPVQKVGHLPPPLQDDLQAILNEQVDDGPRRDTDGRGGLQI